MRQRINPAPLPDTSTVSFHLSQFVRGGVSQHILTATLKLRTVTRSPRSKPEVDWEDIRQIVRLCALKPDEEPFRSLILRYGGEDALRRIQQFRG